MNVTPHPGTPALQLVPSLEDVIRERRHCKFGCPMVDALDQRIERQRRMALKIIQKRGLDPEELTQMPPDEVKFLDEELQLCYNVLRDCDYIDSLR
ncbi:MAG: hypothetical protein AMJ46_14015 [Latescibacteria bacterium DG_63]|nr:MAG: hypothetical protein AMJ46_14015 [Latescibacteria bacterium DG_63]